MRKDFLEFKKKYNVRHADCCEFCKSFHYVEKIEKYITQSPNREKAKLEPRTAFLGECEIAKNEGNPVTKTISTDICDVFIHFGDTGQSVLSNKEALNG